MESAEADNSKEIDPDESSESEKEIPDKKPKIKVEKENEEFVIKEQKPKIPVKPSQQASYIMKLFDRSVNLAKFADDTPLYSLCRAWMLNQPRQLGLLVKSEKNPDSLIQTVEEGDVVEMPKVLIRKGGKPLVQRKEAKINKKDFDKMIDSEVWTKEKLLEFHRSRWVDERQKQIENTGTYEQKYFSANLQLLDSLINTDE